MDSAMYWKNRETEQRKHNIQDEAEYQKHIQEIYQNMIDEIEKEINGFYGKYASKEGITLAEAKKRAAKADIEALGRRAAKYVKEKNFSQQANDEMRLYNMTMKVNRLELLKAQIGLEMVAGFDEMEKYFGEILTERAVSEFERQAGILGMTIQNNAKAANAIVNASFHNATYSDRIWMYQDMLKNELSSLLQTGLIQGQNPRRLATHLRKRFGVSQSNAERLMITELARVQTEAQKQSFERNSFEEYTFLALGDACPICKALDEKHFKVAKMMPGTNAPPMHPYCRCSVAAHEDSEDYEAWISSYDWHGLSFEEWKRRGGLETVWDDVLNRNYKQLSLEEFKKMHHTVSKEERRILYGRSHFSGYINSSNARKLNGLLRSGETLNAEYQEIADTLSALIQRNAIPEDISATRYVRQDAMQSIIGVEPPKPSLKLSKEEYFRKFDAIPDQISKGRIYTEKGFLSVSGVADKNVMVDKMVQLNIKIPKGTPAYITTNYKESEIILDRGTRLEITGARIENSGTSKAKIVLECIVR